MVLNVEGVVGFVNVLNFLFKRGFYFGVFIFEVVEVGMGGGGGVVLGGEELGEFFGGVVGGEGLDVFFVVFD